MTGFSADWLRLREPFDREARAGTWPALALRAHAAGWRAQQPEQPGLSVIDLACGSGANLRALAPQLGGAQCWRLLDHDPALLAALPGAMAEWAGQHGYRFTPGASGEDTAHATVHAVGHIAGPDFSAELVSERADLASGLAGIGWAQARLVTGSALLDLVSAEWLAALVQHASHAGCALAFALSVDGRTEWAPADGDDEAVHALFGQHQRRDKGFGPALGPEALAHTCERLAAAGYTVVQARSDWAIFGDLDGKGAGATAMQSAMVDGMAAAATEQDPASAALVQRWKARRLASLGTSRLTVGHQCLLALPGPGPTADRSPSGAR